MNEMTNHETLIDVEHEGDASSDRILARIGQLTRTLRDSMRELGLDKQVEAAAEMVPDARDRLKYVATMTEQAAERALNAIELAKPIQETMQRDAQALDARWEQWYGAPLEHADEVHLRLAMNILRGEQGAKLPRLAEPVSLGVFRLAILIDENHRQRRHDRHDDRSRIVDLEPIRRERDLCRRPADLARRRCKSRPSISA